MLDCYRNVEPDKPLVIDVETNGLDWKRNHTVGFVLTTGPHPSESWYLPIRHEGGNLDPDRTIEYVKDLVSKASRVVGHYFKFDLHFLANDDIRARCPAECTMVNAALIDENCPQFSLQYQSELNGVQVKKGAELYAYMAEKFGGAPDRNQMGNYWKLRGDDPIAVDYAVGDGTSTWQLWEKQQLAIERDELQRVHSLECRLLPVLMRMERLGVRVDEERLEWFVKYLMRRLDEARAAFPDSFNVSAPTEIRRLLEANGITGWPMTAPSKTKPSGQPSFAEHWLQTFPLGEKIVRVRKIEGMMSRFISPLKERHLFKGRVHSTFNQLKMDDYGTMARLSSSDPNMQQIPKRDKVYAPLFRSVFIPDDGMVWSSNDYSQQDYRVFADYSKEPVLVQGYNKVPSEDIHAVVAQMLSVERDPTAKRMNMGMLNNMGYQKLADSIGCSLQEAKTYKAQYNRMLPGVKKFNDRARERAEQRGYVFTKLGRRARFPVKMWSSKAPSRIIQGNGADMTKLKMVEIDDLFAANDNSCQLLLQVHDSLDWQYPKDEPSTSAIAREIMQSFGPMDEITFDIPMLVEHGDGPNYGVASFPKFNFEAVK